MLSQSTPYLFSSLATRPGRFEYIHTPKHGFRLNLIECAFSKMALTIPAISASLQ